MMVDGKFLSAAEAFGNNAPSEVTAVIIVAKIFFTKVIRKSLLKIFPRLYHAKIKRTKFILSFIAAYIDKNFYVC